MKLYGYWRSSAAYRVRIALNLKNIECQHESVHLIKDGGEQHFPNYQELNPNELVPTLVDGELVLNQSLAILEYLEQAYPQVPLLPKELNVHMACRAFALDIACDIHLINNLRILQHLTTQLEQTEQQKIEWIQHWLTVGFSSLEKRLASTAGTYCFGDEITWADICLVPQVYNAERFNLDMSQFPKINEITRNCRQIKAFIDAAPENQPDAVK